MWVSIPIIATMWALIVLLGVLLVLLYRQIGHLYRLGDVEELNHGLPPGSHAPEFDLAPIGDRRIATGVSGRFPRRGQPGILMFADPGCAACEVALHELEESVLRGLVPREAIVVATVASDAIAQTVEAFRETDLLLVRVGDDAVAGYQRRVTPLAFSINDSGVIVGSGSPQRAKDIAALWEGATAAVGNKGQADSKLPDLHIAATTTGSHVLHNGEDEKAHGMSAAADRAKGA